MRRLLHLSLADHSGEVFSPRVPLHRTKSEDSFFRRVCFSESLDGALNGLGGRRVGPGDIVFVHSADVEDRDVYEPSRLMVPDVADTLERWVLRPVRLRPAGKIFIEGSVPKYVEDPSRGLRPAGYVWEWKWLP